MGAAPVNFANELPGDRPRSRYRSHFGVISLGLASSVVVLAVAYLAAAGGSISRITNRPFLQQIVHLVTSRAQPLRGETNDRINFLLLGMGGAGHEGPYLTDTIILASIQASTKRVALLSIPRDLAVEIPGHGIRKINAANAVGRDRNYPGGGERLTADVVGHVVDLPIHYVASVDFRGFERLVDDVGGLKIDVERNFVDGEYPTKNFGYQTVSFQAGPQRMNGRTALAYVRSRHGTNGEGSDFARSRRQQKVLQALKGKLFSLSLLASPSRLSSALTTFGDHARTDLEVWEMLRLASLVRGAAHDSVTRVLDTTTQGLLADATGIDGAYLLVPRAGDFREVQGLAQNLFALDAIAAEQPTVAVDGSRDRRLGDAVSTDLAIYGATVLRRTTQAPAAGTTVVYDLTGGQKPQAFKALADAYGTADGTLPFDVQRALARETVDFLIVVGERATASSAKTTPRDGRAS